MKIVSYAKNATDSLQHKNVVVVQYLIADG